jgi:hypothetical protein
MKKLSRTEPNAIVLRAEDTIHMFLLDEEGISNFPSIPISDFDNVYEWLKKTQVSFVNTLFIDKEEKEIEIKEYSEVKDLKYSIRDLYSITIFNKENEEVDAEVILREGALNGLVQNSLKEKHDGN